jgi:hypothetical protein
MFQEKYDQISDCALQSLAWPLPRIGEERDNSAANVAVDKR